MTNRTYLQKRLNGLNLSDDDIDIILIKSDVDVNGPLDIEASETAVYKRFSVILQNAAQNISLSGVSLSWNMEALKLFYAQLCIEWGFENVLLGQVKNKVRDASNRW